jgi:hypothetical protein
MAESDGTMSKVLDVLALVGEVLTVIILVAVAIMVACLMAGGGQQDG